MKLIISIIFLFVFVLFVNLSSCEENVPIYQTFNVTGMKCIDYGEIIQIDQCQTLCQYPQDIHYNFQMKKYQVTIYYDIDCTKTVDYQFFDCPVSQIGEEVYRCSNGTENINYSLFNITCSNSFFSANIGVCTQLCGYYVKFNQDMNMLFGYNISFSQDDQCSNPMYSADFKCLPGYESISITVNDLTVSLICNFQTTGNNSSSSSSTPSTSSSNGSSSNSEIDGSSTSDSISIFNYTFILVLLFIFINILL